MHSLSHLIQQPSSAAERALCRWFPWCNPRVVQALHVVRPHYPLIQGGKTAAARRYRDPDGGLAA